MTAIADATAVATDHRVPTPSPVHATSIPYRSDIDGIRAIAVVLVVLYHAGVPGFSGGYVGVDVFFALSGFLITSVVMAQHEADRFTLVGFYAGRVRRLLPLSMLTILTTVVAGAVLLPATRSAELMTDARSAVFYVANWRFADKAVSYTDTDVADSMLIHFWSLSVEEQFYFGWPLLIVVVVALARRSRRVTMRTAMIALTGAVTVASLVASVALTRSTGSGAYYATHLRLWEISGGALVAALSFRGSMSATTRTVLQALAIGSILLAAFRFDDFTPYPGSAALLPVVPTLVLIVVGGTTTNVDRLFASRPFRYIGERSFAIYLWHWPMLGIAALLNRRYDNAVSSFNQVALALVAAVAISHVTHVLVENPIRFSTSLRRWSRASVAAAFVAMALFVGGTDIAERRIVAASAQVWEDARVDPASAVADYASSEFRDCHYGLAQGASGESATFCAAGDPLGDRTIVLIGDSHGQHWAPAFDEAGRAEGWRVLVTTRSSCPLYDIPTYNGRLELIDDSCRRWGRSVEAAIAAEPRVDLVVGGRARAYLRAIRSESGETLSEAEAEAAFEAAAFDYLSSLLDHVGGVILMEDTPWAPYRVPDCLVTTTPITASECDFKAITTDVEVPLVRAERNAVDRTPSDADAVLSFDDLVCPGGLCRAVESNGLIIYRDQHHMTAAYSRSLGPRVARLLADHLD